MKLNFSFWLDLNGEAKSFFWLDLTREAKYFFWLDLTAEAVFFFLLVTHSETKSFVNALSIYRELSDGYIFLTYELSRTVGHKLASHKRKVILISTH